MISKKDDIIIFCQAPSDVPLFLTLYEEFKLSKNIILYVINVENNYKFIKELDLQLKALIYIPYLIPGLKNPFSLFKERNRINNIILTHFSSVVDLDIYFFSRFEDWLTGALLHHLHKRNKIKYVGNYDDVEGDFNTRKRLNFKRLFLRAVFKFLTRVNFKLEIAERLPEFPLEKYSIINEPLKANPEVYDIYGYQTKNVGTKPVALFLIVPFQSQIFIEKDYQSTHIKIIELLKLVGWAVAIKGHPRLGLPAELDKVADFRIPNHVPSEFVKENGISMCLGVITAGIVYFAKETFIPTYSLMNLFEFTNENLSIQYKEFLKNFSNNKIEIFEDFEAFKVLINDMKNV